MKIMLGIILFSIIILLNHFLFGKSNHSIHTNRSYFSSIDKEINILDFGADPSGKSNCSAIIQAAIDSAGIGGIVYIPIGLFSIENTVILSNKDKFRVKCDGQLLINLNQEAFRLINCSWCNFDGLYFISKDSSGIGIRIIGNSRFNVFENILGQGLNNYLFEIENKYNSGSPNGNIIRNIDTRYSKGLLKDIADDNTPHGEEISVYDIRGATRLDNYDDRQNCPAYIWCKNIHDIFLSNIEGEHKYTLILLQGDCNATITNVMGSSYEESTVKFEATNKSKINLINFTDSYLWGVSSNHKYYNSNYGLEVSNCHMLNINNLYIENYDRAGICQKSDGSYYYSNIRFIDNQKDIEFYSLDPKTTTLNFDNISVDHFNKGQSIFFAADSVHFNSTHLRLINSIFDTNNQKENSHCKIFNFKGGIIDTVNCKIYP